MGAEASGTGTGSLGTHQWQRRLHETPALPSLASHMLMPPLRGDREGCVWERSQGSASAQTSVGCPGPSPQRAAGAGGRRDNARR